MGEFADSVRKQAAETVRHVSQEEVPSGADPLLELMAVLLEDGAGGIQAPNKVSVSTEQWLTWNRLASEHKPALVRTMTRELETERVGLPTETDAMTTWAAQLLLATLGRLGMM